MCGVVAVALGEAGPSEPGALQAIVAAGVSALAHRGPDGRGVWSSPDGRVALGHARLAVTDPVGGAQPIASEDGSIVAVVNGELYGHEAQARWLAGRGHRLCSRCDAEVLVHLYEELGDDLVREVRGELRRRRAARAGLCPQLGARRRAAAIPDGELQAWDAALMLILSAAILEARYRT